MQYAINFLGALVFLFIFWKKLKEDYISRYIFSSALFTLLFVVVAAFISKKFFSSWWFWFDIVAVAAGIYLSVLRYKMRFFEALDATTIALLPWFSFVFLFDASQNQSWFSFSSFVFIMLLVWLYVFLLSHYKNFSWYKSGKIGFSALATLGVYFLVRGLVSGFFPFMLSFVGKIDAIISGVVSFIIFMFLYNLSRKV